MANIRTIRDFQDGSGRYARQTDVHGGAIVPGEDPRTVSLVAVPSRGPFPDIKDMICPRANWRTFTAIISIIDVLMFIITLIVGAAKYDGAFVKENKMGGPSALTLRNMGGKYEPDIRDSGEVFRLVTPIFLHAGLLHILSNVFFQCRFGFTLEMRWGIRKFMILYFLTGIGASFWSCVLSPESVSVGASGALFGIVGCDIAFLALNWAEIPQRGAEACFIGFVTLINIFFGFASIDTSGTGARGGVDNWAHVGGLVTGIFAGAAILDPIVQRPNEKLIRGVSGVITGGLFLLFILLLWVGNPGN